MGDAGLYPVGYLSSGLEAESTAAVVICSTAGWPRTVSCRQAPNPNAVAASVTLYYRADIDGLRAVAAMRRGLKALLAECETTGSTLWLLLEVPYQPAAARQGILAVQWLGGEPSFKGVDRATHARRVGPGHEFLSGCASPRLRVVDEWSSWS